jgi:hypothetical protein
VALAGTGLSRSTVLFLGWFGPRGLASIVLGLVYLERHANLPGESSRLAVWPPCSQHRCAGAFCPHRFHAKRIATWFARPGIKRSEQVAG